MDNTATTTTRRPASLAAARTYTIVWFALILLTGVTVATADTNFRQLAIVVCLGIAAAKSILVFLYFMHLRHERSVLIKLVIPITIVLFAIFIGLTYSDIITR